MPNSWVHRDLLVLLACSRSCNVMQELGICVVQIVASVVRGLQSTTEGQVMQDLASFDPSKLIKTSTNPTHLVHQTACDPGFFSVVSSCVFLPPAFPMPVLLLPTRSDKFLRSTVARNPLTKVAESRFGRPTPRLGRGLPRPLVR